MERRGGSMGVCEFHANPEYQLCVDCGVQAWQLLEGWRVAHEDFNVHDALWDLVCPDDEIVEWVEDGVTYREGCFVICIGCFEKRLGRELTREDFKCGPYRLYGIPPSYRFRSRWKARQVG
jgi:hypothetical protein